MYQFRLVFAQGGSSAMGCWNMILMILMFVFSTIDVILDWLNYEDFTAEDYRYGLVSGPPSTTQLHSLLIFCIVGTLLYLLETVNMLSMLRNNGYPVFPVLWELGLIMCLEEIPLCAINLAIVLCRFHQNTPLQIASSVFGILNIVIRFLAFDTKEAKEKGIKSITTLLFGFLFLEWMTILVLSGFIWGHGYSQYNRNQIPKADKQWLDGVSVLLLHNLNEQKFETHKLDITAQIQKQGLSLEHPFLVRDLSTIGNFVQSGFPAYYPCNLSAKLVPDECGTMLGTQIVFRFRYMYNPPATTTPLGDVSYRYGILFPNMDCVVAQRELQGDWQLFYLNVRLKSNIFNKTTAVEVSKPWDGACTVVHPLFDATIDIC